MQRGCFRSIGLRISGLRKMPLKMELVLMLIAILATMISTSKCDDYPRPLEDDFRFSLHQDLMGLGGKRFTDDGVTSFGEILFDVARDQIFVGARDNLYRLSPTTLAIKEKTSWPASEDTVSMCLNKGQSEDYCHNYIRVLLSDGGRLFTCGTNAFSPKCSWRELENITSVINWVSGVAKCPHNPDANITALMTMDGQLYVGTPTDFAGSDLAIYRALNNSLRTIQYDSKWLNEPQFVGSFETDDYVFFVFRESAVEYINCGKRIYSRIARVCKNDAGGIPHQALLRENWTTFVKARLNCSIPGEYPFYYDEVQGVHYLQEQQLLYLTFTTPSNSIAGSAICVYNMSAINRPFQGPFKHQEKPESAWEKRYETHQLHNHCVLEGSADRKSQQMANSARYQLMDNAIQPATAEPLHTANFERYTHLTATTVSTRYFQAHVLFVATDKGYVKKISVYPHSEKACLIEIWKPELDNSISPIKKIDYLKVTNSIYIGTANSVLRIPAGRCNRYTSRNGCLGAQDPLCGWDNGREVCNDMHISGQLRNFRQDLSACPNTSIPVDGGWSSWSEWEVCLQKDDRVLDDMRSEDSQDKCQCQTRQCNNPAPKNGGKSCSGSSIRVTNCTVHGEWTAWSGWSACSATCSVAIKWRRRTCGAPAPAHGGRLCVGSDRDEIYCTQNPPCPTMFEPVREPGWSNWSEWGTCSAQCGGGARWRYRQCNSPPPLEGTPTCPGCSVEAEPCNTHACDHLHKTTATDWLTISQASGDDGYTQKKFKFTCKAQTTEPIKLSIKSEERYCSSDGSCGSKLSSKGWSLWSEWDECSVKCGGGYQTSTRICLKSPCEGNPKRNRACNTHSCTTGWSCWGEWSPCSSTCGSGQMKRTRSCLVPDGCLGDAYELKDCDETPCEDDKWNEGSKSTWTDWSICDKDGMQYRCKKKHSFIESVNDCQGQQLEKRECDEERENDIYALPARRSGIMVAGIGGSSSDSYISVAIGVSVLASILFILLVTLIVLYTKKSYCFQKPRIPSSPHFITQPNSYVSIPLKEVPKKHKTSFNGVKNGTGTMTKQNNINNDKGYSTLTPKLMPKAMVAEYDTGTLKRNSQPVYGNCRNNLDPDSEKFY